MRPEEPDGEVEVRAAGARWTPTPGTPHPDDPELLGRPPLQAWELDRTHPSDLGFLLDGADLRELDDHTLVEVVAAWQRVASWVAAELSHAAGALAERPSMNPEWPPSAGRVRKPCVAGEELALRLGWTRRAGERLVARGTAFRGVLAWTGEALATGAIDQVKADVLVDALADQPAELALQVQHEVLDDAPGLSPTQLRRRVQTEVLRADPAGAHRRHEAAMDRRRVDRPRLLPDGMAGVWAVLDAADAVRIDNGIDALARTARNAGDPRTLDQLRADVLADVTLGRLTPSPPPPATEAEAVPSEVELQEMGSPGVDPPGAEHLEAAERLPVDVTALPQRAVINVAVSLSTLLGVDDEPATLACHGPVHADTARALALGGTWRRIVTDPLTGAVLDVGRTRYRPPAALADHVRHRDGTCVRGGCATSAHACEIDHTIAWDDGGTTSERNLAPLCKRDHLLKTHAAFRLEQTEPGRFRWRTPTGHTYDVEPGHDAVTRHHRPTSPWDHDPPPF